MTSKDIYSAESIKAMDEGCGIDSAILMENAANALYGCLLEARSVKEKICIVCGKGNNGGDGYALGVILLQKGLRIEITAVEAPNSKLAALYRDKYLSLGGSITQDYAKAMCDADVIVDCLFGFSMKGSITGIYADLVRAVNESKAFVIAADMPSGLIANSDALPEVYIKARLTCTFTALKPALASYPAASACGRVKVADIGIPEETINKHTPLAIRADERLLKGLPQRPLNSHKGTFGCLAALCGNAEMCGAAYLACLAALKSGVGMVRLYTDEGCAFATKTRLAEAVISAKTAPEDILYHRPTALLVGCGCGRSYDSTIKALLTQNKTPTVIDADGLNCIAGDIQLYRSVSSEAVVTPHPAEMARLMGTATANINSSRMEHALTFAKEYGFVTVLKGARTVIASPDGRLCISPYEGSALAKAGSGDVLAGLIASLLAQGMKGFEAACLGVYLHSTAAERLTEERGVYAVLPSELPEIIGRIMYFG